MDKLDVWMHMHEHFHRENLNGLISIEHSNGIMVRNQVLRDMPGKYHWEARSSVQEYPYRVWKFYKDMRFYTVCEEKDMRDYFGINVSQIKEAN